MDVSADENGLAILKNLVKARDADVGEILRAVVGACLVDGVMNDVMHGADRQVDAEEIAAKFVNAAIGTVADQGQTEGGLLEPILGDGQMEEDLLVGGGGREGIVQGGLGTVALLIDKLATDTRIVGQAGDGLMPGKGLHAEGDPFAGPESFGGAVVWNGLLQCADDRNRMAHVCFLHEKLAMYEPPVWGKQTIQKIPTGAVRPLALLPRIDPGPWITRALA